MNRIDVSVIQANPSKILTTQQQQSNLIRHPYLEEQQQDSIKTPQSFLLGQGSHSRKFTIFKELQGIKTTKSQSSLNLNKPKIQFKIPSIDDYYIKQSRENIHPNKIHRMESMIYTHNRREERVAPTAQNINLKKNIKTYEQHTYRNIIFCVILLIVFTLFLQKGDFSIITEISHKFGKLF